MRVHKFKLVIMEADAQLFCDPEWVVSDDLGNLDEAEIVEKVEAALYKAERDVKSWDAENARIFRDGR